MPKKLLLIGLLFLLSTSIILYPLFLYLKKGYVKIEPPFLGRIDFSQTLLKEKHQLGLDFYGPIEAGGDLYLIGRVLVKETDSSDNISLLTLATNRNIEAKAEFTKFDNTIFYFQIPPNSFDRLLGTFRYKKFKKLKSDLISEWDWLSVLYTDTGESLIITKLNP